MAKPHPDYGKLDDAALATGLGLVLLGSVVFGFFETVLGSAHISQRIIGVGVIVVHVSFSPHLRAYIMALGFLVVFAWCLSRVGRAIIGSNQ